MEPHRSLYELLGLKNDVEQQISLRIFASTETFHFEGFKITGCNMEQLIQLHTIEEKKEK